MDGFNQRLPGPATMKEQDEASRLREILAEVASRNETITYRELAEAMEWEPPGVIRRVASLLERTMGEDAEAGRPFAATVVVSQTEGLPRRGYFQRAAELGRFQGRPEGPEARAFFQEELRAALSYWDSRA